MPGTKESPLIYKGFLMASPSLLKDLPWNSNGIAMGFPIKVYKGISFVFSLLSIVSVITKFLITEFLIFLTASPLNTP